MCVCVCVCVCVWLRIQHAFSYLNEADKPIFISLPAPWPRRLSLGSVDLLSQVIVSLAMAGNNKRCLLKSGYGLLGVLLVFHADTASICDGDKQKIKLT